MTKWSSCSSSILNAKHSAGPSRWRRRALAKKQKLLNYQVVSTWLAALSFEHVAWEPGPGGWDFECKWLKWDLSEGWLGSALETGLGEKLLLLAVKKEVAAPVVRAHDWDSCWIRLPWTHSNWGGETGPCWRIYISVWHCDALWSLLLEELKNIAEGKATERTRLNLLTTVTHSTMSGMNRLLH